MKNLQDEYLTRQGKAEAQQEQLSSILDLLGYVPEVSDDSRND
ncbi:transcriptional repressor TraM [Staphylococcus aureus]